MTLQKSKLQCFNATSPSLFLEIRSYLLIIYLFKKMRASNKKTQKKRPRGIRATSWGMDRLGRL